MIGSIGAYSGYDSIFSIGYSARAAAAGSDFSVPESPLTNDVAAPANDPVQDSVELSRDYPQLVVGQTYSPPMEQQIAFAIQGVQQPSAQAESDEEFDYLNDATLFGRGYSSDSELETEQGQVEEGSEEEELTPEEAGRATDANGEPLSAEEDAQVREMARNDREVRQHEQAHQSVGGAYAGGASYGYEQGPDGQRYAVSGEVSIDISAEDSAEATVAKMQQVRAAAMAPADPSGQDYKVAAQATQLEAEARQQMSAENAERMGGGEEGAEAAASETTSEAAAASATGGLSTAEEAAAATAGTESASVSQSVGRYNQASQAAQQYQFSMAAGGGAATLSMPENYRPINIVA